MNKVRVGLVGAGYLGSIHARLLAGQEIDWRGVYDLDAERRSLIAGQYHCRDYGSLEELIRDCEALVVASATSSHYAIGRLALESRRHVFLEKPMTVAPAEGEELVRLARSANLVLQVGHVERFNRAFRSLGTAHPRPQFVESHRLTQFRPRGTDVAVVLDLMIHDLDLILKLVGEYPTDVQASGVAVISEGVDIANARLTFPSGAVANVTASRISANPMRKLRMFAADSYISLDFATGSTQVFRIAQSEEADQPGTTKLGDIEKGAIKRKILFSTPQAPDGNAIELEQRAFFEAIRTGSEPPVTGEDGLAALRLATDILQRMGTSEIATGRE